MKSLKPRLLTAAIGVPFCILVIVLSELWLPTIRIIAGLATSLMVFEYLNGRKLAKKLYLSIPCIAFPFALLQFVITPYWFAAVFAFLFIVFVMGIFFHDKLDYSDIAYSLAGTLMICVGMGSFAYVCSNEISLTFYFFLVLLLPWMSDVGAFFAGSLLGRHKLCPNISPKKTVEGAIGGIVMCVVSAVGMGLIFSIWVLPDVTVNFWALIVIALFDSVASIVGDLSFSLIKRSLGIKDYGTIFPGHGGMLDRFDSVIFTVPFVLIVNQFFPILTVG